MTTATYSPDRKVIVMLGVHPASKEKGGIASVVDVYRANGLFSRWPILYIGTMASGSHFTKLRVAGAALWTYSRALFAGRVALVHAQTSSRASFWRKSIFILLAHFARRPVILHLHGAEFEQFYRHESGPCRRWLIRSVLESVARVVVLSSQWQEFIQGIAPAAKVVKIVNPIPLPATVWTTLQRDQNSLLFLGRFGRRKGIFDLLEALVKVRSTCPEVRLRCGGDGDVAGVRDRARELKLDDCVEMIGWVSGAAKERELSRAAVYVLPSYAEGLPMGILEAMAAGAPTIATTVGGIPDAIEDGVDGFLLQPGDVDALADRIVRLLGSVELRTRFSSAARSKAENLFSAEKVLTQLEDLYRSLGMQPCSAHREQDRAAVGSKNVTRSNI